MSSNINMRNGGGRRPRNIQLSGNYDQFNQEDEPIRHEPYDEDNDDFEDQDVQHHYHNKYKSQDNDDLNEEERHLLRQRAKQMQQDDYDSIGY